MAYYEDGPSWDHEDMFPDEKDREVDSELLDVIEYLKYILSRYERKLLDDDDIQALTVTLDRAERARKLFNSAHNESWRVLKEEQDDDE